MALQLCNGRVKNFDNPKQTVYDPFTIQKPLKPKNQ